MVIQLRSYNIYTRCNSKASSRKYNSWNTKFNGLFVIHDQYGRPQPIRDLRHDDMRIHIGHLKQGDQPNILSLVVLSYNLVREAAGAVIINISAFLEFKS